MLWSRARRAWNLRRKARDLAQKTFDITAKEQELGAGSSYQTLTARRDLAEAESTLVAAMTAYQKAKIELDRSMGSRWRQTRFR